ncbi:MAG: type III pantothenate kinase [Gammaproteobacteria bacterium]
MILLVDIGNTALKWATCDGGAVQFGGRASWKLPDAPLIAPREWEAMPAPQRMLVASVAGADTDQRLAQWCETRWDLQPEFVVPRRRARGVENAYVDPARLGVDRWAALLAVRRALPGAACIVDCGSAITVDVLAADGQHLGGLIVPGLALMAKALEDNTAIHLDGEGEPDVRLLARDTAGAVSGGALYAAVAFIDRVVSDTTQALGVEPARVITGGDAPRLLPLLSGRYHHLPDLVLHGLAVIAEGCE